MKLPNFKRLNISDFSLEDRDLVDKLSTSLNIGIEQLYQALNNRLTRADNFLCTEKDIVLITNADGTPKVNASFTITFPGKALSLSVEKIDNLTKPNALLLGGVSVLWQQTDKTIIINQVTGLIPGNQYRLHVIVSG